MSDNEIVLGLNALGHTEAAAQFLARRRNKQSGLPTLRNALAQPEPGPVMEPPRRTGYAQDPDLLAQFKAMPQGPARDAFLKANAKELLQAEIATRKRNR